LTLEYCLNGDFVLSLSYLSYNIVTKITVTGSDTFLTACLLHIKHQN